MRLIARLSLVVIVSGIVAGPGLGAQLAQAQTGENRIVDFDFSPSELTVDAGDVVEWTNTGDRPHTFSDRGGTFDSGPIAPGATGSATLSVPGQYYFFCRINPGSMNGTVTVRLGDEAPSAVRIQAVDPAREGQELSFDPNEVDVPAGTPVVLANVGGLPHTLTADDGSFTTGIVPPGASQGRFAGGNASVVPTRSGDIPFHCDVHPAAMTGVLRVTGDPPEAGPQQGSAAPNSAEVEVVDFAFEPPETSVAPGGTVTWKNTGEAPHTATFDDVELDTGNIEAGNEDALVAPAEPGNYSYRCNVHPGRMRAVLVVAAPGAPDPTQAQAGDAAEADDPGPGTGVSILVLATGVGGAFLGGFGVASFLRRNPSGRG